MAKRGPAKMTKEHKAALAEGRAQGRAVRNYLEALERHKPRRGRKRSPDSIRARIDTIDAELDGADPLKRLHLVQERLDLESALESTEAADDLSALEDDFVEVAAEYGARKGISYAAWRALGVAPATLSKAGITRAS